VLHIVLESKPNLRWGNMYKPMIVSMKTLDPSRGLTNKVLLLFASYLYWTIN
jgi:hypothetical protein